MLLTIITINRDNASGLDKTMRSVLSQTCWDFEYIVIDGGSTDGSVEIIRELEESFGGCLRWVSEPDNGIYNAMNKGIQRASGDYIQFLNSGDILVSDRVVERMISALKDNQFPPIMYGNELRRRRRGILRDRASQGRSISFFDFYNGTPLFHSPVYISKSLFCKYGLYDENMKIVSDWKWYFQALVINGVKTTYVDLDVTLFDTTGISWTRSELLYDERRRIIESSLPKWVLEDYDRHRFAWSKIARIEHYPWIFQSICIVERLLLKYEKWQRIIKSSILKP